MGAKTILASVGRDSRNRYPDVVVVQLLLKDRFRAMVQDGIGRVGESTIAEIERFQSKVMGMRRPSGRLRPGGPSIRALTFEQLPLKGYGWYTYGTSPERMWGTWDTVASLRKAARRVKDEMGIEIGLSDISYRTGKRMPPHKSHRKGVNVDMRPLRSDGLNQRVWIRHEKYSRERTRRLVEILREDPNVVKILFNDRRIPGVKSHPGHHNHLHINFAHQAHPYASRERALEALSAKAVEHLVEYLPF